jgi:hypothetical protein
MLSFRTLSKRRELKGLKRKRVKQFIKAMQEYPQQIAARDQLIAYLKQSRDELFNQLQGALKKVEKYEKKD